ncbi:MAG: hypothetical protein ABSA92_01175 [Candidatus Bathyarchaeia archaeon]
MRRRTFLSIANYRFNCLRKFLLRENALAVWEQFQTDRGVSDCSTSAGRQIDPVLKPSTNAAWTAIPDSMGWESDCSKPAR